MAHDLIHRTEAELVALCVDGDQAAWTELVRRFGRLVYSIAGGMGLDADQTADVFQTVFVLIHRNLPLLDHPERIAQWIATITRREAWRARRRTARERGEALPDDLATDPEADAELERMERRFLLERGLEQLDDRCRQLLGALFFDDPPASYEETARALGMPLGSLGPTRARCLEKLRRILEELGGWDGVS